MTQHFLPELLGSAPYCADIARWLADGGYRTTVLTSFPAYPDAERFAAFRARAPRRELRDGLRIERVTGRRPKGRSALARIVAESMFLIAGAAAITIGRIRREALVMSLCPSILAVALGVLACRRDGRHVAVVHDIQSGLADALGMVGRGFVVRCMRWLEGAVLNRVDLVIVLTREMRDELRLRGVVAPIEVVPVWVDLERIAAMPQDAADTAFVYSGNLGRKQGLAQILAFADALRQRRPGLEILLRGAGNQRAVLDAALETGHRANIRRAEPLPSALLGEGLAQGRVHLVPQDPDAATFAMPSKVVTTMAAGRPVIATARPGSPLWRLSRASRALICVPPNDPRKFVDTALRLIDRPSFCAALGRRARRYVERHFEKPAVLARLGARLERLQASPLARSVLVMDPHADGHQREWLEHILHQALAADGPLVWLVVAPELACAVAAELPDDADDRVRVLPLGALATRLCRHRWLAVSAFALWWSLRCALRRTGATAAHVLFLDHLSLPMALGLGLRGCRLSGILFRPSVHYRLLGPHTPSWRERLRDLRKTMLYRRMLANDALGTVLSLDPYFPRHAARFYAGGDKVQSVPDPVHPAVACRPEDFALAAKLPPDRIGFVLFGFLTERKGTLVVLDALAQLRPATAARIAVMLAGRIDPAIEPAVARRRRALIDARSEAWLHVEDRYLAAGEIEALLDRADVVLAPYQRFVGSSGVLLWAARAGKPVLTQRFGLIGSLVREHGLGLAVETGDAALLADGMRRILDEGLERFFDPRAARAFVADHTPQRFARSVLSCLAAGSETSIGPSPSMVTRL
ncbi:MAG TPA: glycosyltransferase [Stellaceae bacterium]|nr:glycosyltransferase [Stellaceae bacterium]